MPYAGSGVILRRKLGDRPVENNATPAADPELQTGVPEGRWLVDSCLIYDGQPSGGLRIRWTGGSSLDWVAFGPPPGAGSPAAATVDLAARQLADVVVLACFGLAAADRVTCHPRGVLVVDAWSLFALTWSQATASPSATTVRAGSWLQLRRA